MKITKIETQKKHSNRYSLFVDDQFLLGVNEEVLIKFNLHKGQELDENLLKEIRHAEFNQKVYSRALYYLSFGLRSVKEMRTYLNKLKYDQDEESKKIALIDRELIEHIIKKLSDQGYLNDLIFGQSYVRTAALINRKGPKNIQQELIQKGLTDENVETAMAEYPMDQQAENAVALGEKYLHKKRNYPSKMQFNKVNQHLLTKGYSKDVIQAVLEELDFGQSEEKQFELLEKDVTKLIRKQSRKHEGYELKQRVIAGLLRKGHSMDVINPWLSDNEEYFEPEA